MTWRPYLPEPRPAVVWDTSDPEPVVELEVLRTLRDLCANFRAAPREFHRRVSERTQTGYYQPETDIVAVDPEKADMEGMGGDDGYYVTLLHELLHATRHPSRLGRATTGDYSPNGVRPRLVAA